MTNKTYEELVEDYDMRGIIPVCIHFYHSVLHNPVYICPYCKTEFWVGNGFKRTMHCPNCCMEINLV